MRLIDADELIVELYQDQPMDWTGSDAEVQEFIDWELFRGMVINFPAIDAVPVVRCKDCKWLYDEMDDYCCRSHRGLARICENSFCSYGERKDGDGNG